MEKVIESHQQKMYRQFMSLHNQIESVITRFDASNISQKIELFAVENEGCFIVNTMGYNYTSDLLTKFLKESLETAESYIGLEEEHFDLFINEVNEHSPIKIRTK